MATVNGKEVVYVDADDEITAIIDKVGHAEAKIIALVLPKRASVFQSVVNMKLLKRRADDAKKHVVLITSEAGLLPLAGMSGLHVAATLQSKPEIPAATKHDTPLPSDADEESVAMASDDFDPQAQAQTPVGNLSGDAAHVVSPTGAAATEDAIELDNTDKKPAAAAKTPAGAAKPSGGKGFKVPDFFRFRKRLIFGVLGLILLIVLYIIMFRVLPSAAVTIKTEGRDINASVDMTLDTNNKQLDTDKNVVPATLQQQQKTYTQQASATGQKNIGNKASGTVSASAPCTSTLPDPIPAGTGVSSGGLTFITTDTITFAPATNGRQCSFSGQAPMNAQQSGAQYNINNSSVTIAGRSDVEANGSANGGSDNIVKVVQQSDIDGAKAKLSSTNDQAAIKEQLKQALENSGLYAIEATFAAPPSNVTLSTQAGQQADNVTVTESLNYSMYGVEKAKLHNVILADTKKQIDTNKQSILNDGLDGAHFNVPTPGSGATLPVTMSVTATAGPHLDADNLAQQMAGKKGGDVKPMIRNTPGVKDVTIHYSPFWVTSLPHNADKITVVFQKADNSGQ